MSQCLLCMEELVQPFRFTKLFLMEEEPDGVCSACLEPFRILKEPLCPFCHKEDQDGPCSDCLKWQEAGHEPHHHALYRYNQAMKEFFLTFKKNGDYLLAGVFSQQFKRALSTYQGWTLVPIPVSPSRYESRGFNQVTALLDAAGLPYLDLLEKAEAQTQSQKSRQERLAGQQVFSVRAGLSLPQKVLLVDDIYTTGATLHLAYELLREAGVGEIRSWSLAR